MKRMLRALMLSLCAMALISGSAFAAEFGAADEAVAMVKKAAARLREVGKEKAFADFADPQGGFVNRDLYITATSVEGLTLAHGANPKLIGKNVFTMKDQDGKEFIKEYIEKAQSGGGWVEYRWPNPKTKEIEKKKAYVEMVEGVILSCGVYSR